jgi:hypothetical protein
MKKNNTQGGEMGFLMMILLFLVVIFVLWVLTGGQNNKSANDPFINPYNDNSAPLQTYGGD